MVDSDGFVCPQHAASRSRPGCCSDGREGGVHTDQFSCASCDLARECCSVFENCVACCLGHPRRIQEVRARSFLAPLRDADNPFAFCQYKCRTSSGSVVHENSYRHRQKHCFGFRRPNLRPGASVNSDMSTAIELQRNRSLVEEPAPAALDPYVQASENEFAPIFGHAPPIPQSEPRPCTTRDCEGLSNAAR